MTFVLNAQKTCFGSRGKIGGKNLQRFLLEGPPKFETSPYNQWLFLVPLKGGRWHIPSPNWQYIPLIYHLYIAFWGVICYLPPF